ncbi:uncharacterized protein LOC117173822 [Belonocnema kinseyi]|uniref:uncharacterized protein LOC117173822 n=1 Tax=Belonocnema kinseyi TaxID=2817044 RepID=UPI00143D5B7F|nr:uncharacterized protein LOC117173822 [Belonocnema kinseyi]
MIDTFTEYRKLYPIKSATSETAIRKLDEFSEKVGATKKVLSDRGTQFTSKKWRKALQERNLWMILTSIRHPQANMVERSDHHNGWFYQIENIETLLNESYNDTTEVNPHEALWGRKPKRW